MQRSPLLCRNQVLNCILTAESFTNEGNARVDRYRRGVDILAETLGWIDIGEAWIFWR